MKKIVISYFVAAVMLLVGAWLDRHRQTDSIVMAVDSARLDEVRSSIEKGWKKANPNVKDVSFSYYSAHGKIVCCWVNYYY